MSEYDAIIIPGAGVREGGDLPIWTRNRLDYVLEKYPQENIITLSAGTVHRPPPLDNEGFPIFESMAAARYLMAHGFNPERIEAETVSYDTIGNAYFSRILHVQPNQYRRLLIITPDFHSARTRSIFNWVFALNTGDSGFLLRYEVTSDSGIPPEALAARRERERASLAEFRILSSRIASLGELHRWLFREHAAYAVGRQPQRVNGAAREMY